MADDDKDSKTEQASGKRVSEAHDQGQFARSAELGVVCSLAAAFFALGLGASSGAREVAEYTSSVFSHLSIEPLQPGQVPLAVLTAARVVAVVLAPILVATVVASLLAGGLQSGFQLTPAVLGLKLEKLNPLPGIQRLFSQQALVHGFVDFLKMSAIGFCMWMAMKKLLADPLFTTPMEVAYLGQFILGSMHALLSRLMLALGIITIASYAYEKYKTGKDLMMTKEEVKEEGKQADGNPLVKAAIRRMARRFAQKQMLAAVPTADVVITNPTHYAVALKYERGIDSAPVVLAKGENALARRIKALAAEHEVPMVENRPVARMLYATAKVGEPIPSELFQAVAGILAFVYRTHRYYFYRLPSRRAASVNQGGTEL
jgi:flagellar biosynthesis protein FlhB